MILTNTFSAILLFTGAVFSGVSEDILKDWGNQFEALQGQIEKRKFLAKAGAPGIPESNVQNKHSLIWYSDKTALDVKLRRTEALLERLKTMPGAYGIAPLERQLAEIRMRKSQLAGTGLAKTAASSQGDEKSLYLALSKIARQAAWSNPLLQDFDDILFVERNIVAGSRAGGNHMCDQYFGGNAYTGGGLFIQKDFKSGSPKRVDIVAGLKVPSGTNQGMPMSKGAFLSPELSWDGKTVVFAWSSGGRKRFTRGNRWNIFKVDVDGTNLQRLTDIDEDDFDPCWLPNGRIAFISTRRGGFGRCHPRSVPTYTLYSMKDDGSDVICLSYHETNEWHPSVDNSGMIVYSRWDYVDRGSNIAHHIWRCYPDGRDPRAPHGNYPYPLTTIPEQTSKYNLVSGDGRRKRPWMELNIRAIPGTPKYVGTAAPHHGQAYGSLVIIDISKEDDNVMSQLTELTPGVKFPESMGGGQVYGTAWPLSEDFYLCNKQGGMYLLDAFGNEELIHKASGKGFRPLDPIPVRAWKKIPPVLPTQTFQGERSGLPGHKRALISVMNVYIADMEWPAETVIKWMRMVQIFPKSTPGHGSPRITYGSQGLARMSLGVVPVEEDGSVYCEAPVGKEIYFQLLDKKGMAVHSMRSGTYVHAGEHLTCIGCHESKWEAIPPNKSPLALRRPPSKIEPEPGALEPLNFHRLVKPVLDKNCMGCHKGKKPNMSYNSLKSYAFWFTGGNGGIKSKVHGGSRTIPGSYGALYSRLYTGGYLEKSHHNLDMPDEDRRIITLWLDLMSNELGAYQDVKKQRQGELVWPKYDVDPSDPLGVEKDRPLQVISHENGKKTDAEPFIKSFFSSGQMVLLFREEGNYQIVIKHINGRTAYRNTLKGGNRLVFSTHRFSPGLYIINTKGSGRTNSSKFTVF